MDRSEARSALAAFCAAMNASYAGRYWATAGTLLGICRENDLIAHDGDIDFGMHIADYDEALVPLLRSHGFRLRRTLGSVENGLILKFLHGRTKVDIFFFYPEGGGGRLWHALSDGGRIRAHFPPFRLKPHLFHGTQLYVPDPVEAVLAANYGPGWRTPVKRWHYAYSAHNVVVHGPTAYRLWHRVKNGVWQVRSRLRRLTRP